MVKFKSELKLFAMLKKCQIESVENLQSFSMNANIQRQRWLLNVKRKGRKGEIKTDIAEDAH